MNLTPEQQEHLSRLLHTELERENDSLHGKLVFCYVMIGGLLTTIAGLVYLWPR